MAEPLTEKELPNVVARMRGELSAFDWELRDDGLRLLATVDADRAKLVDAQDQTEEYRQLIQQLERLHPLGSDIESCGNILRKAQAALGRLNLWVGGVLGQEDFYKKYGSPEWPESSGYMEGWLEKEVRGPGRAALAALSSQNTEKATYG